MWLTDPQIQALALSLSTITGHLITAADLTRALNRAQNGEA